MSRGYSGCSLNNDQHSPCDHHLRCDCVCSYQEQWDMPLPRSRTRLGDTRRGFSWQNEVTLFWCQNMWFCPNKYHLIFSEIHPKNIFYVQWTHYSRIIKSGGWKRVYFFLSCSPLLETLWAFCLCSAFSDVVMLRHKGLSAVWLYHIVKGKFYCKCPTCATHIFIQLSLNMSSIFL